ncbi:MAG: (d)CMP kinase [Chloroflexi bacterium CFX4]|nr:(d)CMP kinase [Chloroflexi bacterium CFX4]MDL1922737.1 (d)CMP kinase [Chloroflexi bacterium CFX3]
MTLPPTIALDGPAGSGKTTVAHAIATQLGYLLVDTGAFYRAVTLAALRAGVPISDSETLIALAEQLQLETLWADGTDGNFYRLLLNGEDVSEAIRSAAVEDAVSQVAAVRGVRDVLNAGFRRLAETQPFVIMVGRDIGTVVLPEADLKIYLDAAPEVRAARRGQQIGVADQRDVQRALSQRDQRDSQRAVAPLRAAPDAHYIDTNRLDAQAVIAHVQGLITAWQVRHGSAT